MIFCVTHPVLLPGCAILALTGAATAADDGKSAGYQFLKDPEVVRKFERPSVGWKAACGSEAGWRGFTAESRASKETGILWASYTWSIRGKDLVSAAALISAFSQSATLPKSK